MKQQIVDETGKRKKHFLFLLPFVLCLLTLVTGCVQYDVGVNFDSQTRGEIVQHIKLGDKLTSFSSETVGEWLKSVERRVRLRWICDRSLCFLLTVVFWLVQGDFWS